MVEKRRINSAENRIMLRFYVFCTVFGCALDDDAIDDFLHKYICFCVYERGAFQWNNHLYTRCSANSFRMPALGRMTTHGTIRKALKRKHLCEHRRRTRDLRRTSLYTYSWCLGLYLYFFFKLIWNKWWWGNDIDSQAVYEMRSLCITV